MKLTITMIMYLKRILFIVGILSSQFSVAQPIKPVLNIYYDGADKRKKIEYHSTPFCMLMDTVAHLHGFKINYAGIKPESRSCGQFLIDAPIMSLLTYDLIVDENGDHHNDVVFTVEDSTITVSPYSYYNIDTSVERGSKPQIDVHYDLPRRGNILEFKNASPVNIINLLAAVKNYTINYKLDTSSGRTVSGILPLNMSMESCMALICVKHDICQKESGKDITLIVCPYLGKGSL